MISDLADFIEAGLNHVWGGRVSEHMPGMSSTVRDGDVGFLTFYCDDYVKWSSIVAVRTPLTLEVVQAVREINTNLPFGAVTLLADDNNDCIALWAYKILPSWIDSETSVSAKLLLDVVANVPNMVRLSREKLLPRGGQPHVPDDLGVLMFFS